MKSLRNLKRTNTTAQASIASILFGLMLTVSVQAEACDDLDQCGHETPPQQTMEISQSDSKAQCAKVTNWPINRRLTCEVYAWRIDSSYNKRMQAVSAEIAACVGDSVDVQVGVSCGLKSAQKYSQAIHLYNSGHAARKALFPLSSGGILSFWK